MQRHEVVWTYAGVRPLLDDDAGDPAAVTRDYALELDDDPAPLMTLWGGKITTFRRLAEEAADAVCRVLAVPPRAWTGTAPLPGGDLSAWIGPPQRPDTDFTRFVQALRLRHPELSDDLSLRLARAYGARVVHVLGKEDDDLGPDIAPGLHEAELRYLVEREWACTADDVLWRRSKLGLHYSAAQREAVGEWFVRHTVAPPR